MEKRVAAFEARRNLGKLLHDVEVNGDSIIVQKHGEPVAAVVPMHVYRQLARSRQAFFDKIRETSERANVPEDEANELVEEAIKATRTGKGE